MRSRFRSATVLAVALLFPFIVSAGVTGDLIGVVTDSTGGVLPGVTVTVTSPNLQGSRTVVTDAAGNYQFKLLPPGTYRAEFSLDGFNPLIRENVTISLETTTKINVSMTLGGLKEAITVTADTVVVDPTSTTVQQNFGDDHLKYAAIGSSARAYYYILAQAPGVAGSANPNVLGANQGQNNYMLDGVTTTDPVTHTFGSNLPFDAIQEISIQTLGKDAEYGRAVGGVVNVVTKTGGNEFSGTLDARYRDQDMYQKGDHFDPEARPTKSFNPAASLGGPIIQDQLWFFGSLERNDTKATNPTLFDFAPGTRAFEGWNSLAKLTFTPVEDSTLSFRYTDNEATIDHNRDSSYYRPEADSQQLQESTIYNVGYDVILSPQWLAQVQVGLRDAFLETRPYNGPENAGILNLTTGVYSENYSNWQYSNRDRTELIASTSYFLTRGGTHAFKAGINYDQSEFPAYNNYTGTGYFQEYCTEAFGFQPGMQCGGIRYRRNTSAGNDQEYYAAIFNISPEETYESEMQSLFVQDEWRPIPAVTARIGVRYDAVDFTTPNRSDTPSLDKVQPRLGLAWDVFNDNRTVLHGFWGQIMDDNGLSFAFFGSTLGTIRARAFYNPATGKYDRLIDILGSGVPNAYDPDLEATYSDELMLGVTQRFWRNTSLDVSALWRESRNMFEDSCIDQQCDYYVMTNNPAGQSDALRNEYQGVIAKVESRPYSWLSALLSYTWSESKGSVEYTQNAGADFDEYPYHFINRFGYLSDDARHRVKLSGFARAFWGTTFGVDYEWTSKQADFGDAYVSSSASSPFGGTMYVLPRGARRVDAFQQLDVQILHEFDLGGVTLGLVGAVYNVFNDETATNLGSNIGGYTECDTVNASAATATAGACVPNPLYGIEPDVAPGLLVTSSTYNLPIQWMTPLRYELGIRFEF